MSDGEDDNLIFEINDFTIVTPIEELCVSVENLIQKWSLYNRRMLSTNFNKIILVTKDVATIKFGENKLRVMFIGPSNEEAKIDEIPDSDSEEDIDPQEQVTPFAAKEEIGDTRHEFSIKTGFKLQYGVLEALVILPFDEKKDMIALESQAQTILGAIKSALHASRCEVPVFLRLKEMDLSMETGYATDGVVSYSFSSSSLRVVNKKHQTLHGLLSLFKEHVNISQTPEHDEIRIAAQFHHYFSLQFGSYDHIASVRSLQMLPFGPETTLPIDSFTIIANWRTFREDGMTETSTHTDFDINYATTLSITANAIEECYLKGKLEKVLNYFTRNLDAPSEAGTSKELLGTFYNKDQGATNAFDRLTGVDATSLKIGSGEGVNESRSGITGPMPPTLVDALVSSIFGDDDPNIFEYELEKLSAPILKRIQNYGDDYLVHNSNLNALYFAQEETTNQKRLLNFKSAPVNSIAWKLAIALGNVKNLSTGNKRAVPQLWLSFVQRLRNKYENDEDIDVNNSSGEIDLSYCYLFQKLQLLQCCIVARRKRHALLENASDLIQDEFYDAPSDFDIDEQNAAQTQAQGRLKKLNGTSMLIGNPSEHLYIPVTQDRSPMTEDMLEQHTNYLCQLSEEERVLAQLEPLKSDMMAFKAANPLCVLADFLRWHSPKDVINETTGELSERMNVPENTWLQCWENAQPVAVINQTRLFNTSKLAEEVLELLENCQMAKMKEWLRPIIFAASYERLMHEIRSALIFSDELLTDAERIGKILQDATQTDNLQHYVEVERWMKKTETLLNIKLQLLHLFRLAKEKMQQPVPTEDVLCSTINKLANISINNLYKTGEEIEYSEDYVVIKPQDPIGRAIAIICGFQKATLEKMRDPKRKEYIIHWQVARPSSSAIKLPHRMYVNLEREFNQICFSLGADCNFNNVNV